MKKLFMFLAVAGLATFGASCGSDDNSTPPDQKTLTVAASPNGTIEKGTSVTFTASVEGKAEAGADFYVNNVKSASPYTFNEVGTFNVVAKKSGFKDSAAIQITVKDTDIPGDTKTLVLTASRTEMEVGQTVNFTLKDNNNASVSLTGVTFKANGETVTNPWSPTTAGTYQVVASKADYNDSAAVTITVTESETIGTNQMKINGVIYDLNYSRMLIDAYNTGTAQNPNYVIKPYELNNGGFAYMYSVFIVNSDLEGVADAELYTQVVFFIAQVDGETMKTPLNTPPAQWGFNTMYTFIGDDLYSAPDLDTLELSWGANVSGETDYFSLISNGAYTDMASDFEINYENHEVDALYYRPVPAPTATALKASNKVTAKKINVSNLVKAKF